MGGPHPAVAEIRRAVRECLDTVAGPVFVACSGGADSLALAAALAFVAPRTGHAGGLITIDHGLQAGSADQARTVASIGHELGLDPVHVITVTVAAASGAGGPEAAARTARYAALDEVARAAAPLPVLAPLQRDTPANLPQRGQDQRQAGAVILLGHTLDDQAETVLLGLGRGSGPRSIAGMRPVAGSYRRPLLGVRRATTRAACAALGLTPWDDPHNHDRRYQRARLRQEVLPLLEDVLHGGVAEALARTATQLQHDLDALERAASVHPARRDWPGPLDPAELATLEPAIRTRVVRDWARAGGVSAGELSARHLAALDALIVNWHGQGAVQLPGGFEAHRASGTLWLRAASAPHVMEG